MKRKIDNVNDIIEKDRIVDITNSNKVIRSTDLIPNNRPIKKDDVDKFVKDFKKEHGIDVKEIKEDKLIAKDEYDELEKERKKNKKDEDSTSSKEGK